MAVITLLTAMYEDAMTVKVNGDWGERKKERDIEREREYEAFSVRDCE